MHNGKLESESKHPRTGAPFFLNMVIHILIGASLLWVYHFHVLRPWEVITVDFRRLSDAKLAQLAERAMAGRPTNVAELETFLKDLNGHIDSASRGKAVFLSGSLMSPQYDLTEGVAQAMGLDLSKALENSLSGMANRVGDTLSKNLVSPGISILPNQNIDR